MRHPAAPHRRRRAALIAVALSGVFALAASPADQAADVDTGAGHAVSTGVTVDLGTAASFAILAGAGVTDTGSSTITGDVGSHPLPAIPSVIDREASGTVDRAGSAARQAQADLGLAFDAILATAATRTVDLGRDQVLAPGTYAVADGGSTLDAVLTLDAAGASDPAWIFVVAGDLVTEGGSRVELTDGALACDVYWRVGGSATLAPDSAFAGSLLATSAVTVGRGATVSGRVLAREATVALDGATITVPVCATGSSEAVAAAQVASTPASPDAGAAQVRSPGSPADASARTPGTSWVLPLGLLVIAAVAVLLGEPRGARGRPAGPARGAW